MSESSLDYIGILAGTDKTSLAADYLRQYERLLEPYRRQPIQLLEIGVAQGGSLATWEQYLPSAAIIGIDNNPGCKRFERERITVEIGSQDDQAFLSQLAAKYQPTIIIDDGSHQPSHILKSFDYLFPCLRPGGIYFIEDVYLHYGVHASSWNNLKSITPSEYFSLIARQVSAKKIDDEADHNVGILVDTIESIEFLPGMIAVRKRTPFEMGMQLDYWFDAARKADKAIIWFHLSWILLQNNDLVRAERAAERCIQIAPEIPAHWPRLSHIQARRGNILAAIESIREGIRLDPQNSSLVRSLANLEGALAAKS